MNRKRKVFLYVTCFSFTAILALTASIHSASALFENAVDGTSFTITAAQTYTVTFYTSYSSGWGGTTTRQVTSGSAVSNIPTVSQSGYTFKGWVNATPSNSNYTTYFDTSSNITSNISLYPILESNVDYAYTNSTYYQANTDVTISSNSIGSTQIGKRYVGITGIPNPVATWNDSRSLYSSSGIYKFVAEQSGAAMIYRKIGFKPNNQWGQNWDGSNGAGFGIYAWDGNGNDESIHLGVSNGSTTLYTYIHATYYNFKFSRYSSNNTSFAWGNQSSDLNFDNSQSWNNNSTNKYSSSTTVLSMNYSGSWVDNWGRSNATWVS